MKTHTATTSSVCGSGRRPAEGAGDRGEEQQDRTAVLRAAGAIAPAGLMPARDRVTGPAQSLCQVFLHFGSGLIGHRVQVLIQLRQQAEAVTLYDPDRKSTRLNSSHLGI